MPTSKGSVKTKISGVRLCVQEKKVEVESRQNFSFINRYLSQLCILSIVTREEMHITSYTRKQN